MNNKLAQHFTIRSLLSFTAPTCIMMVFMAVYQMTDAVFVSNFVGPLALSALNIVFPIPSVIIAVSIMLATGGSAVIARNMGEGRGGEAKENFSMLIAVAVILGVLAAVAGAVWIEPVLRLLGATDALYPYCYDYLLILVLSTPLTMLQMLFQTFFVTAGKPHLGLGLTVLGGLSNIALDALFVAALGFGVKGAAVATAIGYTLPALISLAYFTIKRDGTLYLVRPRMRWGVLARTCANGSSEMVTNLAIAVVTLMFNQIMLRLLGEDGVAAITIVLYAQFLLTAVFIGFASGAAPIFSYNYGNENHAQIRRLFRMSIGVVAVFSLVMFAAALALARPVISVFARPDSAIFAITYPGFLIFSVSYLFTGVNIFSSGLFTAFSNGRVSAFLSFLRTFVFLVGALLLLPGVWGVNGVWLAVPVAEGLALLVSLFCLWHGRTEYHYG